MRDYAETVQAMRYAFEQPCYDCVLGEKCNWGDFCFFKRAADAIEELLDELTTIRKQLPHWISVEDELPPKYHQVLCYGANGILVDYYSGETSVLGRPLFMVSEARVSHWMPPPEPPTEGAE